MPATFRFTRLQATVACSTLLSLLLVPVTAVAGEVNITGEGSVEYQPDQVRLQLTARAEKPTSETATQSVKQAVSQWEKASGKLRDTFEKYDSANLQLYTRHPRPTPDDSKKPESVTVASQTIRFVLTDLNRLNPVLQAAQASGLEYNLTDGSFFHTSQDKLQQEALGLAIDDARHQCEFIAQRLSQTCGEVKTISTGSNRGPVPMMMSQRSAKTGPVTAIGPREIKMNVNATFEIK